MVQSGITKITVNGSPMKDKVDQMVAEAENIRQKEVEHFRSVEE